MTLAIITPLEEFELTNYYMRGPTCSADDRSPLGGQLERAELSKPPKGCPRGSRKVTSRATRVTVVCDLADRMGESIVDWLRVDRRLRAAGNYPGRPALTAVRIFGEVLGPRSTPLPVLPLYEFGRVMLLTRAAKGATADELARADEEGRKGNQRQATRVARARIEAERLVAWAEAAYAATRPARREPSEKVAAELRRMRDAREAERQAHFSGRTDEQRRVIYATPSARAAGGRR